MGDRAVEEAEESTTLRAYYACSRINVLSGRVDGLCRFGVAGLSVATRNPSAHLSESPRLPCGSIADAMAHHEGRERSTMEGAGQRSMKVS